MTPFGKVSPSANSVRRSIRPSPSVSSSLAIRPTGGLPSPGPVGYPRFSATNSRPRSSNAIATGLTTSGSAATSSSRRPGSSRNDSARLLRHERAIQPGSRRGGLRRLVGRPGEPVGSQQQDDQRRSEEATAGPLASGQSGTNRDRPAGAGRTHGYRSSNRGNLIIGSATRRSRPQDQQAPPRRGGPGTAGSEAPDRLNLFSTPPEVDELAITRPHTSRRRSPSGREAHCLDSWAGLSLVDRY